MERARKNRDTQGHPDRYDQRKINLIKDAINNSDLFNDQALLKKVIEAGVPKSLVGLVGINRFLTRVPQNYLRALFASRLAGRYVYQFGLQANEVDFYRFIYDFKKAGQ